MTGLSRPERLQIMLTPEELRALDDWRFSRRMPSRAAAVRELLQRGLAAEGFAVSLEGAKSAEYGIITRPEDEDMDADGDGEDPENSR